MRFFINACAFCMLIASVGCITNNWSSPLFENLGLNGETSGAIGELDSDRRTTEGVLSKSNFWKSKFGEGAGIDQRAREIEARLGL